MAWEKEYGNSQGAPLRCAPGGLALPSGTRQDFHLGARPMKIKKITIDRDPYEPFRLAQGYRVGELLFISGQRRSRGTDNLSVSATSMPRPSRSSRTSSGSSALAARASRMLSRSRSSSGTCRTFRRSSSYGVAISRLRIRLTRSSRSRPSTPPTRCSRLRRSL